MQVSNPSRDSYIDRLGWFYVSAIVADDKRSAKIIEKRIHRLSHDEIVWFQSRIPYYGQCIERVQLQAIMKPKMFG